ncbi:MAG: GLUG motif-containing protein, partial [Planctomycetota bacterium]
MVASRVAGTVPILIAVCFLNLPALAQYSGGSGTADDPYQIATAEDLIALGETPEDYDKHFILTADIDLDPNLPGRKVFDRAVIAPDVDDANWKFDGAPFTGQLDGIGHVVSNVTISGHSYLGMFGQLSSTARISNLGLEAVDVNGTGERVGGLVGSSRGGSITASHSNGAIMGDAFVGGLVGSNHGGGISTSQSAGTVSGDGAVGGLVGLNFSGSVAKSYSTSVVSGTGQGIGGLVGHNDQGSVTDCYAASIVSGEKEVGGLVGSNLGTITTSYSAGTVTGDVNSGGLVGKNQSSSNIVASYNTGAVTGNDDVGGLVGKNSGCIIASYSTGAVRMSSRGYNAGGLVGYNAGRIISSCNAGTVSGIGLSIGGLVGVNSGSITASYSTGKVTGENGVGGLVAHDYEGTITSSFWDVETSGLSTSSGGTGLTTTEMRDVGTFLSRVWDFVDEIRNGTCDYWEMSPGDYPRLRYEHGDRPTMPEGLGTPEEPYLIRDARDLGTVWFEPVACYRLENDVDLSGVTWMTAVVPGFVGTFDGNGHVISNLHIEGGRYLGVFGRLDDHAKVSNLGLEAVDVNGTGDFVGGLAGHNDGCITSSYSEGIVSGRGYVGGLIGSNSNWSSTVTACYSAGEVGGQNEVGGLVGYNFGTVTRSYSTGIIAGEKWVGGLVGNNWHDIRNSYSTGMVAGETRVGGLVGGEIGYSVAEWLGVASSTTTSFWDEETSGQSFSAGGAAKTTSEMQTTHTFFQAGWDFVEETANGPNDIWKMWDGYDYPRLAWEAGPDAPLVFVDINDPGFYGQMSRYEVTNAQYCDFLNAALASGDIILNGTK